MLERAPRRSTALTIALALLAAKLGWALVLMQVGDYDYRRAHGEDVLRVVATFAGIPIHIVLGLFLWRRKKWAANSLLVVAVAGAVGVGGSGLLFGLPHALARNYDRDAAMIPFLALAIALNLALAFALWRARRDLSSPEWLLD